jgi:hypothetical protein
MPPDGIRSLGDFLHLAFQRMVGIGVQFNPHPVVRLDALVVELVNLDVDLNFVEVRQTDHHLVLASLATKIFCASKFCFGMESSNWTRNSPFLIRVQQKRLARSILSLSRGAGGDEKTTHPKSHHQKQNNRNGCSTARLTL